MKEVFVIKKVTSHFQTKITHAGKATQVELKTTISFFVNAYSDKVVFDHNVMKATQFSAYPVALQTLTDIFKDYEEISKLSAFQIEKYFVNA